jgi:hypothetical protein
MASNGRIINPAVPNLPLGTQEYERRYQDQFANVLRLYFNQLRNALGELFSGAGGKYIAFPYGAFEDTASHTVTANTANAMTFNTTDYSNGVTMVSNSKITVDYAGIYNLQFSTQFQNSDTQLNDVSVWLRKNGADIVGSTGYISVPNKHGGVDGHGINGWNFFVQMNANDYVELWWSTTNAAVTIQAYAVGTSPTRPSTASNVVTLTFVSALPA